MGEAQDKELNISFHQKEVKGADTTETSSMSHSLTSWRVKYKRWLEITFHSLLVLICLSAATLLGELYYKEGGKSTWMNSLIQTVGFPIFFPILFLNKENIKGNDNTRHNNINSNNTSSILMFLSVYVFLGFLFGGSCILNAVGLSHLPVSTFSLISASQLGFNALFSYFLNSQKITTYIANSIMLLTISSILLVFDTSSDGGSSSKGKYYIIGFICTLFGALGIALLMSSTERIFRTVMKKRDIKQVMTMVIWQSFFATCVILIGLFASGEWKWINKEMQEYKLGKVSYVMTLVWNALTWQIYTIGLLSLIMKVSALFANVITTLSVPLIPILALIFFHEKMSGVKAVSMILAIWGFLSYGYQQYLDEIKVKSEKSSTAKEESELSLVERGLSDTTN